MAFEVDFLSISCVGEMLTRVNSFTSNGDYPPLSFWFMSLLQISPTRKEKKNKEFKKLNKNKRR